MPAARMASQIFGDLADAAVEEFDQIVAGVEAGEEVVFHEQAVAQPILLAEDDGFGGQADRLVDLGMGYGALAQSAVGAVVIGGEGDNAFFWGARVGHEDSVVGKKGISF